jgi:hypothetical protein
MSMQMDACLKKEQIGPLFVWVGALEGGFGGWVVHQGCPPHKDMSSKNKKMKHPPVCLYDDCRSVALLSCL